MQDFINRLKRNNHLSPSQMKVARYIIDHPEQVAISTAKKIGEYSNTSETTLIRLCYALGYSGYNELQTEIRLSLLNLKREKTLQELQNVSQHPTVGNGFVQAVTQENNNFRELNKWDDSLIQKVIEKINTKKDITVIGLRTSFGAAHWLAYTLNIIRGNTTLYQSQIGDPNSLLTNINKDSLIIAFTFPRYSQETIKFVQTGKERGATIIGISDHELSPLSYHSDIFLKVTTPKPTVTKGMGILFFLLTVIINGVIMTTESKVKKRLKEYNKTDNDLGFFLKNNE